LLLFLLCGVKTMPPWPFRGRARTKNLLKATQRRAPTSGRDFRNGRALANKTIGEGAPIRQYRANHDFGVSSRVRSSGRFCPRGDPPLLLSVSSRCRVGCKRRELQTSEEVEMRRVVGQKGARLDTRLRPRLKDHGCWRTTAYRLSSARACMWRG
jgi:hypothetical protein